MSTRNVKRKSSSKTKANLTSKWLWAKTWMTTKIYQSKSQYSNSNRIFIKSTRKIELNGFAFECLLGMTWNKKKKTFLHFFILSISMINILEFEFSRHSTTSTLYNKHHSNNQTSASSTSHTNNNNNNNSKARFSSTSLSKNSTRNSHRYFVYLPDSVKKCVTTTCCLQCLNLLNQIKWFSKFKRIFIRLLPFNLL